MYKRNARQALFKIYGIHKAVLQSIHFVAVLLITKRHLRIIYMFQNFRDILWQFKK